MVFSFLIGVFWREFFGLLLFEGDDFFWSVEEKDDVDWDIDLEMDGEIFSLFFFCVECF